MKVIYLRQILPRFPEHQGTRTFRDASIQVDKLERMADAFTKKFGWKAVLSMSPAKLRKKKGPELHRLTQQAKRVDALMTELFLMTLRDLVANRNPSKAQVKRLPMLASRYMYEINQTIHGATQEVRRQLPSAKDVKGLLE